MPKKVSKPISFVWFLEQNRVGCTNYLNLWEAQESSKKDWTFSSEAQPFKKKKTFSSQDFGFLNLRLKDQNVIEYLHLCLCVP